MELAAFFCLRLDKVEISDSIRLMKDRQCLGRLFRAGQNPVVVVAPPSMEAKVVAKIQQKLIIIDESIKLKNGQTILLGPTTESTGESLHSNEELYDSLRADDFNNP
jgi:hypothetical protein